MPLLFGDVSVEMRGNHPVIGLLKKEYSLLPKTNKKSCIVFNINKEEIRPDSESLITKNNVSLSNKSLFIKNKSYKKRWDTGFNIKIGSHPFKSKSLTVDISCDPNVIPSTTKNKILSHIYKFINWNYLSTIETSATNLVYNAIEPIIYLKMLQEGEVFIHSSGVMSEAGVILFAGWGGVGKTGVCTNLVHEKKYKFMGDDLCIIRYDGTVYSYTKSMQIYAYNTREIPFLLNKIMNNRGIFDRINWIMRAKIRGIDKVRRRVSPEVIFGKVNISDKGKISKLIFIVRGTNKNIYLKPVEPIDASKRCTSVIAFEFRNFLNYIRAWHALDPSSPTVEEIINASMEVYLKAFSKSDCHLLTVPLNFESKQISDFLEKNKIL